MVHAKVSEAKEVIGRILGRLVLVDPNGRVPEHLALGRCGDHRGCGHRGCTGNGHIGLVKSFPA